MTGRSRKSSARSAASGDFSVADSAASTGSESFKIDGKTTVYIDPPSGMVGPGQTFSVTVSVKAGKLPQRIRGMLESRLFDETGRNELVSQYLNLRGEVQAPKTIMYPLLISLGHVYVGQPVKFSVSTENLCNLPTKFKLTRPGGETSTYSITYENGKGALEAKGIATTHCTFTALTTGFIDDVIANKIFGAQVPLGFEVKAHAKGILLEFRNLEDDEEPPAALASPTDSQYPGGETPPEPRSIQPIDMGKGKEVPLYERKCVRFVMRNFSAIPAEFQLVPKNYAVKDKVRKLGDRSVSSNVSQESSFTRVERTDGIIVPHELGENKFYAAAGKKYVSVTEQRREDRLFLYSGLGASYFIDVVAGTIPPWGVQVITLRSFNDIPGNYDSDLECTVREGEIHRNFLIPLKMTVTGCPIIIEKNTVGMTEITTAGGNKSDLVGMQMLQMGYCCVNSEPLVREFYVKNNGSKQGKVKWLVRSIASKARGPVKVELKVNREEGTCKSSIQFWEDLAKDSPFKVEPDRATVPPYGRQKFKVTLFRTDKLGKEVAKVTGSIVFNDELADEEETLGTAQSSSITSFALDKPNMNPTVNNKFTIGMILYT